MVCGEGVRVTCGVGYCFCWFSERRSGLLTEPAPLLLFDPTERSLSPQ